jgi:DNA (cytosine-5)-methyltransferase 1
LGTVNRSPKEHRINLRLPAPAFQAIEELRFEGKGKLSYNAWVARAIEEKIARDSVREPAAPPYSDATRTFFEFFAGGGMARLGLGSGWQCLFANDFDPIKARAYRDNWDGGAELVVQDVNSLTSKVLPGRPDLVWASFPCQDLSLAGKYAGLGSGADASQTRSGTFWPFWRLVKALSAEQRGPKVVVLENVAGILTANQGRDFAAIAAVFADSGYQFGAVVMDAKSFVPQSRPRVFFIGVQAGMHIDSALASAEPTPQWHTEALRMAYLRLSPQAQHHWKWWSMPEPRARRLRFADVIEASPTAVAWHTAQDTKKLLGQMSPLNLKKVEQALRSGKRFVGGVYRRTRLDSHGEKAQRAEVRFDDIAGCLRTPSGGSSRQLILVIESGKIRSRLLSPREAARLMGLPDSYQLPDNYNQAYFVCGDGVAAPVVGYLAEHLLNKLVDGNQAQPELPLMVA